VGNKNRGKAVFWRNVAIALVSLIVLGAVGAFVFSVSGDNDKVAPDEEIEVKPVENQDGVLLPPGVTSDNLGKAASLSLAAYDQESNSKAQVAVPAHTWAKAFNSVDGTYAEEWDYMGPSTLTATGRTTVSGFNVGDKVRIIAFNGSYIYGDKYEIVVTETSARKNLDVYKGATSATITFFDENDNAVSNPTTTGNVTIGSVIYNFAGIKLTNGADQTGLRPYVISVDIPTTTNISEIRLSGAETYDKKVKRLAGFDYSFVWDPGNVNNAKNQVKTGTFSIVPDGDNIQKELINVTISDMAPFIDNDNQLAYGVQDDELNAADVGAADFSQALMTE
jgi:hypothetical protein